MSARKHRNAGRHNRQLHLVGQEFREKLRLVQTYVVLNCVAQEREKMLCDQVLHQQFLSELMAAFATVGAQGAPTPQPSQQQQQQQPQPPQQQQQDTQRQQPDRSTPQQQVPSSYVARLLRRDIRQQLQQVLQMTAQDWLEYFSSLFPKVLFLLEMVERSDSTAATVAEYLAAAAGSQDAAAGGLGAPPPGGMAAAAAVGAGAAGTGAAAAGAGPSASNLSSNDHNNNNHDATSGGSADGNLLAQWFGGEPPLGMCAAADYARLQETIDGAAALVVLAYVFNELPMLQACTCSYCPGPQLRPGPQHWVLVTDRLELTPTQELHMSICLAEYRRLNKGSRADGGSLIQSASVPNLLVAAAQAQQQRQCSPPGAAAGDETAAAEAAAAAPHDATGNEAAPPRPAAAAPANARPKRRSTRSSKPGANSQPQHEQSPPPLQQQPQGEDAVAAATAATDDGGGEPFLVEAEGPDKLRAQLKSYVQRRHIHLLSCAVFFMNTLSPYQLAKIISASYPFLPSFTAVAEVCCTRVQQRQQQQLQQQMERAAPSPTATAAAAAGGSSGGGGGRSGSAGNSRSSNSTKSGTFLQSMLALHEQQRAEELALHRQVCWSELDALGTRS